MTLQSDIEELFVNKSSRIRGYNFSPQDDSSSVFVATSDRRIYGSIKLDAHGDKEPFLWEVYLPNTSVGRSGGMISGRCRTTNAARGLVETIHELCDYSLRPKKRAATGKFVYGHDAEPTPLGIVMHNDDEDDEPTDGDIEGFIDYVGPTGTDNYLFLVIDPITGVQSEVLCTSVGCSFNEDGAVLTIERNPGIWGGSVATGNSSRARVLNSLNARCHSKYLSMQQVGQPLTTTMPTFGTFIGGGTNITTLPDNHWAFNINTLGTN